MNCICEICELKLQHARNITQHQKTEKCQNIKKLLQKRQNENLEKIKNIETKNNELKEENKKLIEELKEKDTLIKSLQEKSEEYRKIVEKVALKTTKTVNKNTYNHSNNYLNYISSEPIKFGELPKQLKEVVNTNTLMFDDNEFHEHIVDNILKDGEGKDKILCTDINRKNFSYKDETSGQLISDPELERLREKLKKGADITSVKRELLDKLIQKYEGTNIDPYVKFYDFLKKLDFGNPFIDHVAKKTYIKTKSGSENEIELDIS